MEPERLIELEGFLDEFRTALEEEIESIKKSGQSSILLRAGHRLENGGAEFRYIFKVDYMPTIPADTPCKLVLGNERYDVSVIGCDGDNIIIASSTKLPDMLGSAQLENGSTVLMELLIKCLKKNADKSNQLGRHLIRDGGEVYQGVKIHSYDDLPFDENFTQNQKAAVEVASTYDVAYIWGPPGTGKTTVIGKVVKEVFDHERSVLIVSHTNTAVDEAIEKAIVYVDDKKEEVSPVLRLGTPVTNLDPRVLIDSHVKALGKELHEKKAILMVEKGAVEERLILNTSLIEEDNWIKNTKIKHIEKTIGELESKRKLASDLVSDVEESERAFKKIKEEHPEYAEYNRYKIESMELTEQLERLSNNIETYKRRKRECLDIKEKANAEARMHDVYADLKAQEAKYMPIEFLRKEAETAEKSIQDINHAILTLRRKKVDAEKVLSDYESKGSVGKFFYNRNAVEQAKESVKVAEYGISQNKEILDVKTKLLEEYKDQIQQVLLLQEKERAVVPSSTKEYWEGIVEIKAKELEQCNKSISECVRLTDQFGIRQKELELKTELVVDAFKEVSAAENKYKEKKEALTNVQKDIAFWDKTCKTLVTEECSLCGTIWKKTVDKMEVTDIFKELSTLKDKAEVDLKDVNIEKCKEEKEEDEKKLHELSGELGLIEAKIQQLEAEAIRNARIVGTTLSKAFIDEKLRERTFDTVILDEASMASIPALWCASLLAENSVVIVGDFLQLPPIYVSNTEMSKKWLGTDVFEHSGMIECLERKKTANNFVMLNEQFRMESDIAELANNYYKEFGALKSNDNGAGRIRKREAFYQWYPLKRTKGNVHLIDTESLNAWVTGVPQGRGHHSRLNSFSASISVELAFKIIENKMKNLDPLLAKPEKEPSVLIIAPYKPHIDRVRKLIDLEYKNRGFSENLNFISAGTVHSFQGNEADVVIFDLVVDEPHRQCGLFMSGIEEVDKSHNKMFNVAITRAKFKLFIIGNFNFLQKRAKNNSLEKLLYYLINEKRIQKADAKMMFPYIVFEKSSYAFLGENVGKKHMVCTDRDFYDFFLEDLLSMKHRMVIYSPFMTNNRLSTLLPAFADAINAHKEIVVVTRTLEERGKTEINSYKRIEDELISLGVNVVHKKGMHEKVIIVDDTICWHGSLNALSYTGNTGELMFRDNDETVTIDFEKFIDLDSIYQAAENKYELSCPVCHGEMVVKESDKGGIYWACLCCDFTRRPKQQYPVDGEIKCTCGGSYKFAMKNEPRWVCSLNPKHYQKVNASDLKLSKMLALINKTDQKRVQKFFEEKQKKEAPTPKKETQKSNNKSTSKKAKTVSKKTTKRTTKKTPEEDGQMRLVF